MFKTMILKIIHYTNTALIYNKMKNREKVKSGRQSNSRSMFTICHIF